MYIFTYIFESRSLTCVSKEYFRETENTDRIYLLLKVFNFWSVCSNPKFISEKTVEYSALSQGHDGAWAEVGDAFFTVWKCWDAMMQSDTPNLTSTPIFRL